jgi:hypothetical protein
LVCEICTVIYHLNYKDLLRLFSSSGILENREHDVSETGSVSVLRWRGRRHLQFMKRRVFYSLEYRTTEEVQLYTIVRTLRIYKDLTLRNSEVRDTGGVSVPAVICQ